MGIFDNLEKYEDEEIYDYIKKILSGVSVDGGGGQGPPGQQGPSGVGFKLTSDGDYDLENKKLTNMKDGNENQDALSKKQILELLLLKVNITDLNKMFKFENGFMKGQAYIDMANRIIHII